MGVTMIKKKIKVSSTEETVRFYTGLMRGEEKRGLWGKEKRFSAEAIAAHPSVRDYFLPPLRRLLRPTDEVLDLGTGPGIFLPLVAPLCGHLTAVDIVREFVDSATRVVETRGLSNVTVRLAETPLPFPDGRFDVVLLIDTIHHLENVEAVLDQVHRVFKPGGRCIVFEPNKANIALFVMCLLDKNEHGLLGLGTFPRYEKLLGPRFALVEKDYNPLLIGPDSRFALGMARFLDTGLGGSLRWMLPKLLMVAVKK